MLVLELCLTLLTTKFGTQDRSCQCVEHRHLYTDGKVADCPLTEQSLESSVVDDQLG